MGFMLGFCRGPSAMRNAAPSQSLGDPELIKEADKHYFLRRRPKQQAATTTKPSCQ